MILDYIYFILETNESEKVANDFSLAFKAVQVYGAIQSSYQGFA